MKNSKRTLLSSMIQSAMALGRPYTPPSMTTLNEKFDILPDINSGPFEYPRLNYFTIGNGSRYFYNQDQPITLSGNSQHRFNDFALFNHMPFVLRAVDDDLTMTERNKYALRKMVEIAGRRYWAYYLKRVEVSEEPIKSFSTTIVDGIETREEYTYNIRDINPTKVEESNDDINVLQATKLSSSGIITMVLTDAEIQDVIDAAAIMTADVNSAFISEIGLCYGRDHVVEVPTGMGDTINMNEAIDVQLGQHILTDVALPSVNDGWEHSVDMGHAESVITSSATRVMT